MSGPEIGPAGSGPLWGYRSLIGLVATAVAGAVLLEVAWVGASGQRQAGDQIPWVNLGVLAVLLPVVASRRFVVAGRRSLGRRLAAVVAEIEPAMVDLAQDSGDGGLEPLVAGPATSRYHRAACVLAQHKPFTPAERSVHERAGRGPCEMCRP